MLVDVKDINGQTVGDLNLNDSVFGIEPNKGVMHQALVRQLANARQGTHKVKTRGEVKRTGAKWYRQKGTGRARHGSRSAPIFVGGGKAHGPMPRKYTKKMPKKMRHLAIRSALSVKASSNSLVVVDDFGISSPKTSVMVNMLKSLGVQGSAVVLTIREQETVERSVRNIPNVKSLNCEYLNVRDLIGYDYVVATPATISIIEEMWGV